MPVKPLIQILFLSLLCSCATVDFDAVKQESSVLTNTDDTYLGQQIAPLVATHTSDTSGFVPLPEPIDSLAARLIMANRAEKTIDAQYYLLKADTIGYAFLDALLQAADRGVRVRLLLDDMFTSGYDAGMAGLDSHPNFEIRIFNPFANRSLRMLDGLTSFTRVNRRMHNKSFTADNQITIIGGRNIADEYFGANEEVNFGDLDVLAIGPVVRDVSDMFDSYWNHERSAPISAFANMPDDAAVELERVRGDLVVSREAVLKTKYGAAVQDEYLDYVESDESQFIWAPYTLAVDSPDKVFNSDDESFVSITSALEESLLAAESEIILVSPYFVPLRSGIEAISEVQARGVDVTVITNSLAANNQITVHGGYAPARKPLLRNGVRIYEVRADAAVPGAEIVSDDETKSTLHTKAFIVDRKEVFIGSFNFDPRSANINTELGVIIRSPEMAADLAEQVQESMPFVSYEVYLDDRDRMRWRGIENGQEVILNNEPQASIVSRIMATLLRLVPLRGQL